MPAATSFRVTAVGAVMLSKTGPGHRAGSSRVVACMASAGGGITSGGGFGNLTAGGGATPDWQLAAVRRYIVQHANLSSWPMQPNINPGFEYLVACPNGTEGDWSSCTYGRGYPDLALMGAQVRGTETGSQVTNRQFQLFGAIGGANCRLRPWTLP